MKNDDQYQMYLYLDRHSSSEWEAGQTPDTLEQIILKDWYGSYPQKNSGTHIYKAKLFKGCR